MNRQIRQLAGGLMVCYVLLFVALNYWQVGRQEELNAKFDNTRAIRREFESPAGPIVTIDGVTVGRIGREPGGQSVPVPARVSDGRAVRAHHRLLHVRLRLDRRRAHGERRADRRHRAAADPCAARHRHRPQPRRLRVGSPVAAQRPAGGRQARRSATARARSSCSNRRRVPSRRCGATPASTPTSSPTRTSRRLAPSSRSSRTSRAIRCSPTPTSSGTCRARRSRC